MCTINCHSEKFERMSFLDIEIFLNVDYKYEIREFLHFINVVCFLQKSYASFPNRLLPS